MLPETLLQYNNALSAYVTEAAQQKQKKTIRQV